MVSSSVPVTASPYAVASLADERNVYVRHGDGSEALFDLASDPSESRNLAGLLQSRPVLERFRDLLARFARTHGPFPAHQQQAHIFKRTLVRLQQQIPTLSSEFLPPTNSEEETF